MSDEKEERIEDLKHGRPMTEEELEALGKEINDAAELLE